MILVLVLLGALSVKDASHLRIQICAVKLTYLSFFLTRLMKFEGTIFLSMTDQQSSD